MQNIEIDSKILAIGRQLYDNNKEDIQNDEISIRNTMVNMIATMIIEGLQLYENSKNT